VFTIAGIDPYGRIAEKEINAAFQTRRRFEFRPGDILRYAWING
jgi:hypothetical protein